MRMGEWLHCNVCCRLPTQKAEIPFFFTSCGHILCGKCNAEHSGQCRICGRQAKVMEINHRLPPDVLLFLRDPKDLLGQYVKNVTAVLNFQSDHRRRLNKARQEQNHKANKFVAFAQAELKKKANDEAVMIAQRNSLQEEAYRLRRQCQSLKAKIDELEGVSHRRVRTPTSLGRNRSFGSNGSSDRNSRSSLEFSFLAQKPSGSRTDRYMDVDSTKRSDSFEFVHGAMLNESTEPSSIAVDSLLTTPAILGTQKSRHMEWIDHKSGSVQSFDFTRL